MCGRFTLIHPETLQERFATQQALPGLLPRDNIAPGQPVVIVTNERELEPARWGLVPRWARDARSGTAPINARAETVAAKPAFREPFRHRRCLIPATGFYEWRATPAGKVPYHFRPTDQEVFGMAGLEGTWIDANGRELRTCAVITTVANELVAPIHDRMPVILSPEDEALWLDPEVADPACLQTLLQPYHARAMEAHPVSTAINRVGTGHEADAQLRAA